ncbi:acyl-CoA synthetase [Paramagnetospirillum marisnigri]|uniref:Acyl-CoA synthetase n=1 Tax=Paramagnetospirillum marisnigri TaxID=1285242 RepID=A0A178MTX6_9PROT|nr:AMP-binding protein [Paramagnetospirillum marisnigri]OAN52266.1 acyl-CoA synthetase [Paramagnetospirillum marisnigri]
MLNNPRSYEEACRTFRWKIPDRYNLAFDVCDRQTMAGADGHRTALIVEGPDGTSERYTFHVLRLLANRLANVLQAWGVTPGDRVALALPAGLEAAVALLAVTRMGAVAVPIPTNLGAEPLGWRLSDSGAQVAVVDAELLPALDLIRSGLTALARVLVPNAAAPGTTEFWSEMERASDAFAPLVTPAGHPAFIFYPPDGCGKPPGAVLPHRAMAGGLPAVEMSLSFFPQFGDVAWTSADWMSAEALFRAVLPAWHHGVPVVATPGPFDPARALDSLSRHGVRAAYVPPAHLARLAEAASGRPHAMPRALASGPAPLDEALHEAVIKAFGIHANEAWGVIETGAVAANLAGLMELRPPSPGRTAPGLTIEAVDDRGRVLKAGERGVLAVSPNAPGSFLGYWGDRVEGPARRGGGGWMLTGRLGVRDLDNYIWPEPLALSDDTVMTTEGPTRLGAVEAVLNLHPTVSAAGVVEWPEGELRAFVQPRGLATPALLDEVGAWARLRLGTAGSPRRLELIETLPLAVDGSVLRAELLARAPRIDAPTAEDRWRPQRK